MKRIKFLVHSSSTALCAAFLSACGAQWEAPMEESELAQLEDIESVEQAILGGTVDTTNARNQTVVVNGCSGTLVTNSWILTANHCVTIPPPANISATLGFGQAGQQERTIPAANITRIPCNEVANQQCQDAILLKTTTPFTINGSTNGFVRSQYPSASSTLTNFSTIEMIGWGGLSSTPANQTFANLDPLLVNVGVTSGGLPVGDTVTWNCSNSSQPCPYGGDSGGGGFVTLGGRTFQATIHSGPKAGAGNPGEAWSLATSTPAVRDWLDQSLYTAGGNIFSVSASNGGTAVSKRGLNKLDVFWLDTSGSLKRLPYNASWGAITSLSAPAGKTLTGRPASVSWDANRIDVFARATDNTLWTRSSTNAGTTWSTWALVATGITSSPAVASWGSGRLDLFAKATDSTLWHNWYSAGWGIGESLGGSLTSAPAAVSWASGRIDVVVRGAGNSYYHKWYDGSWGPTKTTFNTLGGNFTGDPAIASWSSGRLDIYGRGSNGRIEHRWYDAVWLDSWIDMGITQPNCGTSAVSWGPGRVDIFTCNSGSIWRSFFPRP